MDIIRISQPRVWLLILTIKRDLLILQLWLLIICHNRRKQMPRKSVKRNKVNPEEVQGKCTRQ